MPSACLLPEAGNENIMNDLLEDFFEECEELLEVMGDGLDAMAAGTANSER